MGFLAAFKEALEKRAGPYGGGIDLAGMGGQAGAAWGRVFGGRNDQMLQQLLGRAAPAVAPMAAPAAAQGIRPPAGAATAMMPSMGARMPTSMFGNAGFPGRLPFGAPAAAGPVATYQAPAALSRGAGPFQKFRPMPMEQGGGQSFMPPMRAAGPRIPGYGAM